MSLYIIRRSGIRTLNSCFPNSRAVFSRRFLALPIRAAVPLGQRDPVSRRRHRGRRAHNWLRRGKVYCKPLPAQILPPHQERKKVDLVFLNPDRGFTFLEIIDIRIETFLLYIPAEYLVFPFSLRSATCNRKHIHNFWGSADRSCSPIDRYVRYSFLLKGFRESVAKTPSARP